MSRARAAAAPDEGLNDKGVELRRRGDDRGALEVFQKAYDLTHSPRASAQLGLVYQALGRWELAGPLIEKALQTPSDPWVKKYDTPLHDAFTLIKQHLARIDLTGEPAGAEVIVNGVSAGHLPLGGPLTVSVGTVDLQVRAPGYRDDIRKVTVAAFQYEHIFVRLDKTPDLAAVVSPAVVEQPPAGGDVAPKVVAPPVDAGRAADAGISPRAVVKWTALGLAVAGLGTGITASVIHQQKVSDFNTADSGNCRQDGDTAKDGKTNLPSPACQSILDSSNSARTWQVVGFVAAGAFAATWLVLQLTEQPAAAGGTSGTAVGSWTCAPSLVQAGGVCAMRF
jgi:hypothetical protein